MPLSPTGYLSKLGALRASSHAEIQSGFTTGRSLSKASKTAESNARLATTTVVRRDRESSTSAPHLAALAAASSPQESSTHTTIPTNGLLGAVLLTFPGEGAAGLSPASPSRRLLLALGEGGDGAPTVCASPSTMASCADLFPAALRCGCIPPSTSSSSSTFATSIFPRKSVVRFVHAVEALPVSSIGLPSGVSSFAPGCSALFSGDWVFARTGDAAGVAAAAVFPLDARGFTAAASASTASAEGGEARPPGKVGGLDLRPFLTGDRFGAFPSLLVTGEAGRGGGEAQPPGKTGGCASAEGGDKVGGLDLRPFLTGDRGCASAEGGDKVGGLDLRPFLTGDRFGASPSLLATGEAGRGGGEAQPPGKTGGCASAEGGDKVGGLDL
eukprot:Hpha_TRINITY_DN12995_c0_g1::TRINITY_DN12995_c0_g1_i2::g.164469::m.164469